MARLCAVSIAGLEEVETEVSYDRNRFFLFGVVLGGAFGFAAGSIVAWQLGGYTLRLSRRAIDRWLRHGPRVRFDLLLQ